MSDTAAQVFVEEGEGETTVVVNDDGEITVSISEDTPTISSVGVLGPQGGRGNSVLNGAVAPTTEGLDGDFYLRTDTSELYGPKDDGDWGTPTSLIGLSGSVILADYSVKTDESLTGAQALSPVEDIDAWESAGGPVAWNVPTDEVSIIGHVDRDTITRMGIYTYDPTVSPSTFTRHPDYLTVESLHGKAFLARLNRKHTDDTVVTPNIANLVLIWTNDEFDENTLADDVDWQFRPMADLETLSDYIEYVTGLIDSAPSTGWHVTFFSKDLNIADVPGASFVDGTSMTVAAPFAVSEDDTFMVLDQANTARDGIYQSPTDALPSTSVVWQKIEDVTEEVANAGKMIVYKLSVNDPTAAGVAQFDITGQAQFLYVTQDAVQAVVPLAPVTYGGSPTTLQTVINDLVSRLEALEP